MIKLYFYEYYAAKWKIEVLKQPETIRFYPVREGMGRSFELSSYLNISEFNSLFPVECPITLILDLSQPETHPGIHQGLLHLVHIRA
ncbi:hypothetical protein PSTG_10639 [Puccinia striiformis f. sp. tritici PST-78]|uniref:Uncharacterized protein n=1 Tax=Puccinia striiformis f. sp. tritici PST-78 TaxID=1165861 RepID=A0A0L0V9V2_9BASI|nr:hypothetical protein PSTG_10639 [Puccinia striiformis f. sp. tritici PST-78]